MNQALECASKNPHSGARAKEDFITNLIGEGKKMKLNMDLSVCL